ncbi:MAG TPA: ABC transporter substrate-binding protein [Chloroflexota bacterium]|nr:ABC transporter substrate-binding protein [Chloroflexota bacterium]
MASRSAWPGFIASLGLVALVACAPATAPAASASRPTAGAESRPAPAGSPQAEGQATAPAGSSQNSGAGAAASPALQAVIDGARQEGQLTLAWDSIDDSDVRQRLAAGFDRAYGLNVNVQWSAGLSMPQMASRIAQEYQAGRPATSDVLLGSESHVVAMMRADALTPVDWTSWAPHIRDARLVAPNGVAVELATRTPGITYNTSRLSGGAVPASMQDLLKPEYKGRLASTTYAANFDRLASPQLWGRQRTLDYVAKLADQVAGLIRCGEPERVANGEFDLLALDCGAEDARSLQVKGAPLGHVIASDAALLSYWYLGVPRNAAHPNAAKLWVDYMLSREGQDLMYESDYLDHHLVPGSKVAPDIERLQASGIKFTEINVQFVQRDDPQAVESVRAELQNLLQKQ